MIILYLHIVIMVAITFDHIGSPKSRENPYFTQRNLIVLFTEKIVKDRRHPLKFELETNFSGIVQKQ